MLYTASYGTMVPVVLLTVNALARALFARYLAWVGTKLWHHLSRHQREWHTFTELNEMTKTSRVVTKQVMYNFVCNGLVDMRLPLVSDDHAAEIERLNKLTLLMKVACFEYRLKVHPRRRSSPQRLPLLATLGAALAPIF